MYINYYTEALAISKYIQTFRQKQIFLSKGNEVLFLKMKHDRITEKLYTIKIVYN